MKKTIIAIIALALSAPLFATSPITSSEDQMQWHTSKVTALEILETLPVRYRLTYEARCNQSKVRKLKFKVGNELVVGVAALLNHALDCVDTASNLKLKTVTIVGDKAFNPTSVKVLR